MTFLDIELKKIIPNSLKSIIAKMLINNFFGKIIKFFNPKITFNNGIFDFENVSDKEAAQIFFGFWESSEIRYALKFIQSKTIIELGSSVGVLLGTLAKKKHDSNFICVEASKINFEKLLKLKKLLSCNNNNYEFINKAIAYNVDYAPFIHKSTKGSKISTDKYQDVSDLIPCITLSKIIKDFKVNGEFSLISDIEGGEAPIFFEDSEALKKCKNIIIELENNSYATVTQQIDQIKQIGFNLVEYSGRVYVFSK